MLFGRNRESRSREAAGRRNWPEAVPRKMRERKSLHTRLSERPKEDQTHESDDSGENVESTSAYSVQGKHLWDRTALHSTAACRVSFVVNTIVFSLSA